MGRITIQAGEAIELEVQLDGDRIVAIEAVTDGGQIGFRLGWNDGSTMLVASSHPDKTVEYDIYLIDIHGKKH